MVKSTCRDVFCYGQYITVLDRWKARMSSDCYIVEHKINPDLNAFRINRILYNFLTIVESTAWIKISAA